MTEILAIDVSNFSPPALRFAQAKRFLNLFNHASRPNGDCWFDMVMYFDAFLFCFVSIEEMVSPPARKQLQLIESFKFFKAMRNVTAHHSIIAGASPAAKFPRPLVRSISMSIGEEEKSPVAFRLKPKTLRIIFDEVLKERPGEKGTIDAAMTYLGKLEAAGGNIYFQGLMENALTDIAAHVA
jgi:hypothetical protein